MIMIHWYSHVCYRYCKEIVWVSHDSDSETPPVSQNAATHASLHCPNSKFGLMTTVPKPKNDCERLSQSNQVQRLIVCTANNVIAG